MDVLLPADDIEEKALKTGLVIYCLLTTIIYSVFQISVVYEICNCAGIIGLTCFYQELWKKDYGYRWYYLVWIWQIP